MKKILAMLIVLMFISSMIVVADDAEVVVEEDDCGFLCTAGKAVGEFLFGSSEARALAGTAWFDRNDGLPLATGMSIPMGSCEEVTGNNYGVWVPCSHDNAIFKWDSSARTLQLITDYEMEENVVVPKSFGGTVSVPENFFPSIQLDEALQSATFGISSELSAPEPQTAEPAPASEPEIDTALPSGMKYAVKGEGVKGLSYTTGGIFSKKTQTIFVGDVVKNKNSKTTYKIMEINGNAVKVQYCTSDGTCTIQTLQSANVFGAFSENNPFNIPSSEDEHTANLNKATPSGAVPLAPPAANPVPLETNPLDSYSMKELQTLADQQIEAGIDEHVADIYYQMFLRSESEADKKQYGLKAAEYYEKAAEPALALKIHQQQYTLPSGCTKGSSCTYAGQNLIITDDGIILDESAQAFQKTMLSGLEVLKESVGVVADGVAGNAQKVADFIGEKNYELQKKIVEQYAAAGVTDTQEMMEWIELGIIPGDVKKLKARGITPTQLDQLCTPESCQSVSDTSGIAGLSRGANGAFTEIQFAEIKAPIKVPSGPLKNPAPKAQSYIVTNGNIVVGTTIYTKQLTTTWTSSDKKSLPVYQSKDKQNFVIIGGELVQVDPKQSGVYCLSPDGSCAKTTADLAKARRSSVINKKTFTLKDLKGVAVSPSTAGSTIPTATAAAKPDGDLSKEMGWGTVFGLDEVEGADSEKDAAYANLIKLKAGEGKLSSSLQTKISALETRAGDILEIVDQHLFDTFDETLPKQGPYTLGMKYKDFAEKVYADGTFENAEEFKKAFVEHVKKTSVDGGTHPSFDLNIIKTYYGTLGAKKQAEDNSAKTQRQIELLKSPDWGSVDNKGDAELLVTALGLSWEDYDDSDLGEIKVALKGEQKKFPPTLKEETRKKIAELENKLGDYKPAEIPDVANCNNPEKTCTIRSETVPNAERTGTEEKQVMYFVNEDGEIQQSVAEKDGSFKTVSGVLKGIKLPPGVGILGSPFKDAQVDNGKTTGIAFTNGMSVVQTLATPEKGQEGGGTFTANVPTSVLGTYTKGGINPRVTKDGVELHTTAGIMGNLVVGDQNANGVVASKFTPTALAGDKATPESYWNVGSKEVAKQTAAQALEGKVTIDGQSVFVSDSFDSQVKNGNFQYYGDKERKTALGDVKITDVVREDVTTKDPETGKDITKPVLTDATTTSTNYKTEVRTTTLEKDKQTIQINDGDCYTKDCGTYHPNSGVLLDSETGLPISLIDFDYAYTEEGDSFGEDRGTMSMEAFDPNTGTYTGESYGCEDNGKCGVQFIIEREGIFASDDGTYSVKSGGKKYELEEKGGKWVCKGGCPDVVQKAVNEQADSSYQSKHAQRAQKTAESVYAALASVRSYSALSKLIAYTGWDPKTWLGEFGAATDELFASMTGMELYTSPICERSWDIEPDGKRMMKTASGTYQPVASIQAERTSEMEPMLCERNPDPEAEEEWVCGKDEICYEDVCYDDIDADGDPDDKNSPKMGYFYKVTWAVSAPIDEAFTPYRDENGIAVSFNIWLDDQHLYIRRGDKDGPIELKNGDSDKQVITKYSPLQFDKAWIIWDSAPKTIPIGGVGLKRDVTDVSFDVVVSTQGQLNWKKSGQPSASTKSTDAEVDFVTEWKDE